jgi:hypothetical protein
MNRPLFAAAALVLCACTSRTDLVGSRYIKKVHVVASQGATITLSAQESDRFPGLTVALPAGALASDTDVTIEEGFSALASGSDSAISPVLWLGPDGTALASAARVTLPISGTAPTDQPVDVQVLLERAGALARLSVPAVSVDLTALQVSWSTTVLGRGQVVLRTCSANGECAPGECVGGRCRGASCGTVRCALGAARWARPAAMPAASAAVPPARPARPPPGPAAPAMPRPRRVCPRAAA